MKCLLLSVLLVGVFGVDEERVPNDIIGVIKKMQSQMDTMEKKVGHDFLNPLLSFTVYEEQFLNCFSSCLDFSEYSM